MLIGSSCQRTGCATELCILLAYEGSFVPSKVISDWSILVMMDMQFRLLVSNSMFLHSMTIDFPPIRLSIVVLPVQEKLHKDGTIKK